MREAYGSNTLLLAATEDMFGILEEKIRAEMSEGRVSACILRHLPTK
jgi:Flp pilus assembly protein TadB